MTAPGARPRSLAVKVVAVLSLFALAAAVAYAVLGSGVVPLPTQKHVAVPADDSFSVKAIARAKVLPDVTGADLASSAASLTALGLKVTILLPSRSTGLMSKPAPSGLSTELVLPQVRVPYPGQDPDAHGWNHTVARQEPSPGTPIRTGLEVTLVAGVHDGGQSGDSWFSNHSDVTDKMGSSYCIGCHSYDWCVRCHMLYTKGVPSLVGSSTPATP